MQPDARANRYVVEPHTVAEVRFRVAAIRRAQVLASRHFELPLLWWMRPVAGVHAGM